ncbi:alpha/beta fold hydrolase [Nonomuraea sp. NN258]|uniref:alpha/beta hydrolase family protein n=1 Tax=Nonomuraea antri TaxID=2730852 RepID=UPI00156805EB|nr:alpha/beta fold hydrolase [Nonomuraea antri]NRQ35912.1 alpha/beta fold hydrolase [Nonomuraea antri]
MHDPVARDPAPETRPPAATTPIHLDSHGETLLGLLHVPAGPGPHPLIVLLHGFPGNERNFDLAQALRRAGYAALVFHYRGSWGSGGSWAWRHVLEDSVHAVAAMRDSSAGHGIDPARVGLFGHSMGGFAALMTAAADPSIGAVASTSGFDVGAAAAACAADPAARAAYVRAFQDELRPLRGTSGEALVSELESAGQAWSLPTLAPRLTGRPVLLIGTARDEVTPVPVHHDPLVRAYQGRAELEHHVFETDHSLSDHRVTLARVVIDFFDRRLT